MKYKERVCEVEYGIFSPLVFSCTGGIGPLGMAVVVLVGCKRIAKMLSERTGQSYSNTLTG